MKFYTLAPFALTLTPAVIAEAAVTLHGHGDEETEE
jgi:hypothetical protein